MDVLKIENFKYGLDTRRDQLVSQPGTLVTLENGHVNSGGEVEKRLAFVADAVPFPTNTFGYQDTDKGPMVFGSAAAPNGPLPTGVVYQQLPFPTTAPGYPGIGIVRLVSCCFKGKPFVLAGIDNEDATFAFYDGKLVAQITDGVVMVTPGGGGAPETLTDLANDLTGAVNALGQGWVAHANVLTTKVSDIDGYHESGHAGSVLIMSPIGIHFTPAVGENNSVAGLLGMKLVDQNYAGIAAVGAVAAFVITGGGGGTIQVSAPEQAGTQLPAFDLTGGNVAWNTSIAQTTLDVVAAINNNTFFTGYSAEADPSTGNITVIAPTSFGNFVLDLVVTTTTITVGAGTPHQSFKMTLTPTSLSVATTGNIAMGTIAASIVGNGGPITFTWTLLSVTLLTPGASAVFYSASGSANFSDPKPVTGPFCAFVLGGKTGGTADPQGVTATFRCTASDGVSPPLTQDFMVELSTFNQ